MKKFILPLLLLLSGLAFSQSQWTKVIEKESLRDANDASYRWRIAGTADDTSEAFTDCYKYDAVSVGYVTTDTIGTDSVNIYIVLQASPNTSDWFNLDSVAVTTATTNYKNFTIPAGGINTYRFRVNGITGNGSDSRVRIYYWARKKADY